MGRLAGKLVPGDPCGGGRRVLDEPPQGSKRTGLGPEPAKNGAGVRGKLLEDTEDADFPGTGRAKRGEPSRGQGAKPEEEEEKAHEPKATRDRRPPGEPRTSLEASSLPLVGPAPGVDIGRVDENEPSDLLRITGRVDLANERPVRMARENERRWHGGRLQKLVKLFRHRLGGTRAASRIAPTEAGSIVSAGTGEPGQFGLDAVPAHRGPAQGRVQENGGGGLPPPPPRED